MPAARSAVAPDETYDALDDDPLFSAEPGAQSGDLPEEEDPGEARHRRVAARAYRLAERRGFAPGAELDDWLAAEAEERDLRSDL